MRQRIFVSSLETAIRYVESELMSNWDLPFEVFLLFILGIVIYAGGNGNRAELYLSRVPNRMYRDFCLGCFCKIDNYIGGATPDTIGGRSTIGGCSLVGD